ncbi:hypothetical protein L3Y34_011718 [Caenorhabditis briggsae]|uniref:Uncharacterized protein n=1 Tax=Caenorhabditis briggsae TaxID=6238 RepID=A0AAE8ZTJ3_CAEBR|nr:hypothetical protein L3Y34_011718 [Caenorhabditis briggsae]
MRFLILFSTFLLAKSAPHSLEEDELPFSTDNFPTLLDEANSSSGEEKDELAIKYSDQADTLKKRLKMKSMFNTNGPPAIGTDLFSSSAVDENIKKVAYEGSGEAVEEHEESQDSTTIDYFNIAKNDSAVEDAVVESSSNSSTLYDQNTSDAQVETVSNTLYQKTEAEVNAILHTSETTKYDGQKEKEDSAVESATSAKTKKDEEEDDRDYSGNATESISETCAPPRGCGKNCFVTINAKGCQDCQCLWIAQDCETDQDCSEKNQYCDLGKCNCQPGYQQNMRKSGICEVESGAQKGPMPPAENTIEDSVIENEISKSKKLKRKKRSSKPRLSERLEWPGVCDKNEQCPDNLVCIHGDCWNVPEKLRRSDVPPKLENMIISRNTDEEEEEEKRVSFDTDQIMEPTTTQKVNVMPTMPTVITSPGVELTKRGMARFVSEDFAKQLQRTTAKVKKHDWFPPTTTSTALPTTQFSMTIKTMPQTPPLTVDQFFMIETTVSPQPTTTRRIENDHKMEYMKERKPNFLGVKEEVQELEYPVPSLSHIKKIHLEMPPPTLLPHRRKPKKQKTTTPTPDDASEVEEMNGVDEIEFPISSKIKNGFKKPRALSAEPTREELKDHKSLVDLFNSHAARISEKEDVKPSFQILQSFSNLNPSPDSKSVPEIQVSLASEDLNSKFSPIPDLSNEKPNENKIITERKPWMIQQGKIYNTAPLSNISEDMASDDPPEVTPEPAPFQDHRMGVWYPMKKGDVPHLGIFSGEFRRAPLNGVNGIRTSDEIRLYHEYTKANRQNRPVRIEMDNASDHVKSECRDDSNCGNHTVCCTKRWCDRSNNCGLGRFCLTSCASTKLTFLPSSSNAESVIDIMYD